MFARCAIGRPGAYTPTLDPSRIVASSSHNHSRYLFKFAAMASVALMECFFVSQSARCVAARATLADAHARDVGKRARKWYFGVVWGAMCMYAQNVTTFIMEPLCATIVSARWIKLIWCIQRGTREMGRTGRLSWSGENVFHRQPLSIMSC